MVIKNCEDKYTYLFRVTKGLKTINAKTTTFSGSRFLVVFLILNSLDQCKNTFCVHYNRFWRLGQGLSLSANLSHLNFTKVVGL